VKALLRVPTALVLAAGIAVPQAVDVQAILSGVEKRYNNTQTLRVNFTQTDTQKGRKRTAKGTLYLRKPGKMHWEYTEPAGQLFISDREFIYTYFPDEKRAEKMKFKEVEDMRAPLAFLLGKLNFKDDFKSFSASPQPNGGVLIVATPKSDRFPYSEVSFLAMPDFSIQKLIVKMQDNAVNEFTFDSEKRNEPVADSMFRFTPPPGVEYVDLTRQ
jgi:outer membrane lipoprotein carrier protein